MRCGLVYPIATGRSTKEIEIIFVQPRYTRNVVCNRVQKVKTITGRGDIELEIDIKFSTAVCLKRVDARRNNGVSAKRTGSGRASEAKKGRISDLNRDSSTIHQETQFRRVAN